MKANAGKAVSLCEVLCRKHFIYLVPNNRTAQQQGGSSSPRLPFGCTGLPPHVPSRPEASPTPCSAWPRPFSTPCTKPGSPLASPASWGMPRPPGGPAAAPQGAPPPAPLHPAAPTPTGGQRPATAPKGARPCKDYNSQQPPRSPPSGIGKPRAGGTPGTEIRRGALGTLGNGVFPARRHFRGAEGLAGELGGWRQR